MNYIIFYLSNVSSYEISSIKSALKKLALKKNNLKLKKPWLILDVNSGSLSNNKFKELFNFFSLKLKLLPLIYVYILNIYPDNNKNLKLSDLSLSVSILNNTLINLSNNIHILLKLIKFKYSTN